MVVSDESGKVLAKGELSASTGTEDAGTGDADSCEFPLEVSRVPKADFYKIRVSHRGELTFSFEEMPDKSWTVGFTLGD